MDTAWNLLFTVRSQYLSEINIVVEHIRDLVNLPNKSEWSDIDEVLCRLSDQSTGAAHPLRVNVHMAHPERYGDVDLEKLRDYLKEAWPLFWEKGEVFLTSYVSIVSLPCGCDISGARLVGGGR